MTANRESGATSVHFVGAGPGAVDLITLRGARLLEQADVVVYAGSLVNPELLDNCRPEVEIYDSASMTLEEVLDVVVAAVRDGKQVVRLHTGDPSLYGAIREQMDALDAAGVAYDVVPGVSSMNGAAAALQAEYTLPGVSQSVIVTRMEGRTPVPEREKLRSMASHGCTMVLFLSTGLLEGAQEELLAGGYAPDTPAAIVYKATWPDEQVFRCTVSTLAQTAAQAGIRNTALVCVGDFLGDRYDRSLLYDPTFTHAFRKGDKGTGHLSHFGKGDKGTGHLSHFGDEKRAQRAGALTHRREGIAFAAFTRRGVELAKRLATAFGAGDDAQPCTVHAPERFCEEGVEPLVSLSSWAEEHFGSAKALVVIGATGIAVRAIAPHVNDKFSDPAVVCVDEAGQVAVPLLSGHVGGANDLARKIAQITGGFAAVSTATDVNGVFAVDEWAARRGYAVVERELAKQVSARLLDGGKVGFASDYGAYDHVSMNEACLGRDLGVVVSLDDKASPFACTLRLVPRVVTVGVGCRKGTDPAALARAVDDALSTVGISKHAVAALASIDVKRNEPALRLLAEERGWDLRFYTAEQLAAVPGGFTSSDFVQQTVGVDNVCERAAVAEGGRIVLPKVANDGITVALGVNDQMAGADAAESRYLQGQLGQTEAGESSSMDANGSAQGSLTVVGLGPGGGNSMTAQAREALQACDLIVGYTTYVKLLNNEFPGKEVVSTGMRQEVQRCRMALEAAAEGKHVAMVCSGDPGVYGMASLVLELADGYPNMDVQVVPGVTAANAGAALLGAPLSHDWCSISLSDLLTPWDVIEKRLVAAAQTDFAIALYNPSSHKRADYLQRACDILLRYKSLDTVCGIARNIGRDGESSQVLTLGQLRNTPVDMFSTVFVGSSNTVRVCEKMVTPRGYHVGSGATEKPVDTSDMADSITPGA